MFLILFFPRHSSSFSGDAGGYRTSGGYRSLLVGMAIRQAELTARPLPKYCRPRRDNKGQSNCSSRLLLPTLSVRPGRAAMSALMEPPANAAVLNTSQTSTERGSGEGTSTLLVFTKTGKNTREQ